MQNIEQKRAAHALDMCTRHTFRTAKEADVVKPTAAMVLDCGLMPTIAYAMDNNDSAYEDVFKAFIDYLEEKSTVRDFLNGHLALADAAELRRLTSEFMAYVRYLRRFANAKRI